MPTDTKHECAIQRAAASVIAESVRWRRLALGGTTNRLFVGEDGVGERRWVLRINAPASAAFGVSRARETAVLDAITGASWAPRVLVNRPDAGWCLFAWHGDPPRPRELTVSVLFAAVAQWQSLERIPAFDYVRLFDAYEARLMPAWQRHLAALRRAWAGLPRVRHCLVHQDLHTSNLCVPAIGRVVVIDWEYAGAAPPWLDAVALCDEFGVDHGAIRELPAFADLTRGRFAHGLATARWCSETLARLWWQVRRDSENQSRE